MKPILGIAALLAGLGTLHAAEWTQFRGPAGSGVSPEKGLPTRWTKTEGLRWTADLPGRGLSNPVIAGGKVYVTACSGYRERRLHVLCFDEKTGKKLWERQLTATGSTACHPVSNMAAPTPVTDGKAVYALFATADLAALDAEGNLLWYRSLVGDYPEITNQVGMASSPVLADGVLCIPMDNVGDSFLAGLDATTGKNLWRKKRKALLNWVTPITFKLGERSVVLFQGGDVAEALDIKTGQPVWSFATPGLSTIPSPTYADGVLYLTSGRGSVIAVKPQTNGKGEELFKADNVLSGYPSPVVYQGKLYGLTDVNVTCTDLKSGTERWKQRVEGKFSATPVIADGKLYAVNEKGRGFVLDIRGDMPKILAKNDIDDKIQATPAIANGAIYLRSDTKLYCIGK
ncbi:MAG: PQQ-binding-like beta-propeller repeat protein [Gemmataceae bacterium]